MISFVLDLLIKATLVLSVVYVLSWALKYSSAATRHLLIVLAFISLLLIPFLSQVLPKVEVGLIKGPVTFSVAYPEHIHSPDTEKLLLTPAMSTDAGFDAARPVRTVLWIYPIFLLWGVGTLLLLVRLAIRLGNASRIRRRAIPFNDPRLRIQLSHFDIPNYPLILRSRDIGIPITIGWWKPVIILPWNGAEWSADRKRTVLIHETAHIIRRDYISTILAHIVTSLYWFNPLIWLSMKNLYIERERACDDYVLASGCKASDYASHLLEIATQASFIKLLSPAGLAFAKKSSLEVRLMSILEKKRNGQALKPLKVVWICLLAISFLLPLASIQTWAKDEVVPEIQETSAEKVKEVLKEFYAAISAQDFKKA
ncbi:M56 family metallopeptidase, partial [Acidobacteriota bacterium]